jgi:hypothetical protein
MIRPSVHFSTDTQSLTGRDGELILLRITVEPRLLERLLETLAETSYHINPQVFPNSAQGARVEFPAYQGWVTPIEASLRRGGLRPVEFEATRMISQLAS